MCIFAGMKVKAAPNSKESEMMVLGCMLTSINSLNIAADTLDESDFYYNEHQILFSVLKNAYKQDKPADVHLVCEELKRIDKLESVGGIGYVTTLAQYAGTSAYIEEYAEIVRSKSVLRRMIQAAQVVEKNALDDPQDVNAVLDDAQSLFFKISQNANPANGVLITDILSGVKASTQLPYLKELQDRQEEFRLRGPKEAKITGIETHFIDFDKLLNGLNDSNLMIVAGRPAMGKTAFAINIAENVCFKNGMPVGIFSLEMSAEQLLHRIICSQAEVESDKIRTGNLSGAEFQRIVASVGHMQKHAMIIDDQPGLKITDLRARARRMKESYGIRLLVIDYLQLIAGSGSSRTMENRQNEISEISRLLKTLARELNIPVICASQLSRKVEDRAGHRPMMSDLRESGCLTADAQIQDALTGKIYTIKELADREVQTPIYVYAVDEHLKIGKHKMIKAFYSGQKKVFELKTRSGRTLKASSNHPFLKLEGWTALENLKAGDRIGIPNRLQNTIEKESRCDEFAFLAHLLGDGCILPKQPYHYTSQDEENLSIVSTLANQLFGIAPRYVQQKNWAHVYFPSPYRLTKGKSHPITQWFEDLQIDGVRSYDKKAPKILFESSQKEISCFLHHLWATDGNISHKKINGKSHSAAIYYASSSKTLASQVQALLLRLNVQSTLLSKESKKGYRTMHQVHIQGAPNQIRFLNAVGCAGKRGHIISELLEQLNQIETNPNLGVIPKEVWKLFVEPAKDKKGMGWRAVCEGINTSYCGSTLFKSGVSQKRMHQLATYLDSPKLLDLATSDVYWDEIASITDLGVEEVYDATVEGVHNFVANDIIVHNSIEQDADIVTFLLRREYYDPNDKPGMAEVIVGKNRHGGIGSVNLQFQKELVQFRNYTPIEGEPSGWQDFQETETGRR